MTDLELNIALAEAMGWKPSSKYATMFGQYSVFRGKVCCNDNGTLRKFDYRDPVIFSAICKRWNVGAIKAGMHGYAGSPDGEKLYSAMTPEYAAAWCVIEAVKRGVKC